MMVVCIRIHRLIKVKKELILNWIQYKSFFEQSKLNILETCFTSLKIHINTKKTPFGLIDYKKTRLIDYPQKMILKANKKLSIQSSFFNEAKILVIQNNIFKLLGLWPITWQNSSSLILVTQYSDFNYTAQWGKNQCICYTWSKYHLCNDRTLKGIPCSVL